MRHALRLTLTLTVAVALAVAALGCGTNSSSTGRSLESPAATATATIPGAGGSMRIVSGALYRHAHLDASLEVLSIRRENGSAWAVTATRINGNQPLIGESTVEAVVRTLSSPAGSWAAVYPAEAVGK